MSERIRNLFSIALIGIFATACLLPGIRLLSFDGNLRSASENRNLAALPARPSNHEELIAWPTAIDNFVADHFGARKTLVRAYNYLQIKIGTSPIKRVLVGKQGWLFLNQTGLTEANRGALPLTPERLDLLKRNFEARAAYLDSLGKALIVLSAPDKNSVYPEYLPKSVKHIGPSRYEQFHLAMEDADFLRTGSMDALIAAKSDGENIYYRTDSHWNCRGAWFAYQAMMNALRESGYAGGKSLAESDLLFTKPQQARGGDIVRNLLNLEGLVDEPYAVSCKLISPSDITATRPSDGQNFDYVYAAPPGKEHRVYKHENPRDGSRVLVYRDSYANALLPFLIETFDEVIYAAPPVQMGFDPADVKQYDPDLVIYEFVERALHYFPDNSLLEAELDATINNSMETNQ